MTMATAGDQVPDLSGATLREELDNCIQRLQDLRVAAAKSAIPAGTRELLSELSRLVQNSSDSSQSLQEEASAPTPLSSATESASSDSVTSSRRNSYADMVRYPRGFSPPPAISANGVEMGKFGSCEGLKEYPSGKISHFQAGLVQRIGMPHLEYVLLPLILTPHIRMN